jgi:hypothetical protein
MALLIFIVVIVQKDETLIKSLKLYHFSHIITRIRTDLDLENREESCICFRT